MRYMLPTVTVLPLLRTWKSDDGSIFGSSLILGLEPKLFIFQTVLHLFDQKVLY